MTFKDFVNETSAGLKKAIPGDDVNAEIRRMEGVYRDCIERIRSANETAEKFLDSLKDSQKEIEKTCGDNRKRKAARDIVDNLTQIVYSVKKLTK